MEPHDGISALPLSLSPPPSLALSPLSPFLSLSPPEGTVRRQLSATKRKALTRNETGHLDLEPSSLRFY